MRKIITYLILITLFQQSIVAQDNTPKFSNEFLSIGIGARAQGMSNSVVASSGDVMSAYWNPAGLTSIKSDFQLGAMHAEWYAGVGKYDYGAFAKPLKNGRSVLAFSLIRFGVDNIPNTFYLVEPDGSLNYDNVVPFSAIDYAFMTSFAKKSRNEKLSFGGTLKIIRRTAGTFASSWGFGIDLGAQYKSRNFSAGLMLRDISSTFNAWEYSFTDQEKIVLALTDNEIPVNSVEVTLPKAILGFAYQFNFGKHVHLTPEINFDFTTDGQRNVLVSSSSVNIDPHAGVELNIADIIYGRAGIGNIQKSTNIFTNKSEYLFQPNAGVGIHIAGFELDYAYTNLGNQSQALYSHVISLIVNFKGKKTKLKEKELIDIPKDNGTDAEPEKPRIIIEQID